MTDTTLLQLVFFNKVQSSVTLNLNVKSPKMLFALAGTGKVPKSHTIDPFAPTVGSNVSKFGVGLGVK